MIRDGIGVYGSIFNYSFLTALFGSTLLVFIYLWRKGLLNMNEDPKYDMMEHRDENREKKK